MLGGCGRSEFRKDSGGLRLAIHTTPKAFVSVGVNRRRSRTVVSPVGTASLA